MSVPVTSPGTHGLRSATTALGLALLVAWALAAFGCRKSSIPDSPPSDSGEQAGEDRRAEESHEGSTEPKEAEKRGVGMAAQVGILGVEPGMGHSQCLEIAKTHYELRYSAAASIEVTGTWEGLPVEMVWSFQDGKLTDANAHFLAYHAAVPLADTPIYKRLVELLGPVADSGSKPRREWVSWSARASRVELAQSQTVSPGRGVRAEYWIYVFGPE